MLGKQVCPIPNSAFYTQSFMDLCAGGIYIIYSLFKHLNFWKIAHTLKTFFIYTLGVSSD